MLRSGFSVDQSAILVPERNVNSMLVLPQEKLLWVAMGLAEPGTLIQFHMNDDGSLTRRAALGMPELKYGLAIALLDKMAQPAPVIYLLEQSAPPALVAVDALSLKLTVRWPLAAEDREVGCGVLLPNGDVLLGMLGSDERSERLGRGSAELAQRGSWGDHLIRENATLLSAATGRARTHIVRYRTSDPAAREAADGLERAAELSLPSSQLVCALSGPQGDFAYFATATVPAQLHKVSVGVKLLALVETLNLEPEDGPVSSCALDGRSRSIFLGMGGATGRLVGVSLEPLARLRGFLRAPGWLGCSAARYPCLPHFRVVAIVALL